MKARLRGALWLGGAALAAGAAALGPGAPMLVQTLGEGRTIWRLGSLELANVSGAWIGDLRVGEARLRDAEGVWLTARNARLHWRPQALLLGRLEIADLFIESAEMARRPALGPPPRSRGLRLSLAAPELEVAQLTLVEAVAGVAAQVQLRAGAATAGGALRALQVNAVRVDAPTDSLSLGFDHGDAGAWRAQADGAPGGILAGLLGAAEGQGVALRALAEGGFEAGSGSVALAVGEALAATARGRWSDGSWSATSRFDPAAAPGIGLARRLGGRAEFEAAGGADGALHVRFGAPNLIVSLDGALAAGAQLTVQSASPDALLGLSGLPVAAVEAEGVLQQNGDEFSFFGRAALQGVRLGGYTGAAEGPVTVSASRTTIDAEGALAFAGNGGVVGRAAPERGGFGLSYDRGEGAMRLREARLEGQGFSVSASGADGRFDGRASVTDLSVLTPALAGQSDAQWRLVRVGSAWRLSADGQARRFSGFSPLDDLAGDAPQWSVGGVFERDGLRVTRATASGPRLRVGARGLVGVRGLDLVWEASARGPTKLGAAQVNGAADAAGRISGAYAALRVSGSASMASLDLGGAVINNANARFAYADGGAAVSLSGLYGDQPVSAMADVTVLRNGAALENVTGILAGVQVSGRLTVAGEALDGAFAAEGPLAGLTGGAGGLSGRIAVSGTGARPVIEALGAVQAAAFGGVVVDEGRWSIVGPLEALAIAFSGTGRVGSAPVNLSADGTAQVGEDGVSVRFSAAGQAAGQAIASAAPIMVAIGPEGLIAEGALTVARGQADFTYRRGGEDFAATLRVRDLPAAAVAAAFGETGQGQLSGEGAVRSVNGRIVGEAQVQARDFRLRGRMRDALNGTLRAAIAAERLSATIDVSSPGGLAASATVEAAVATDARRLRVAQDSGSAGLVQWRAAGPADALWALTGAQDQSLTGQIAGQGEARFGPGMLAGSGALTLRDGVFEDRLSGARLQDVALDVRFSDETVTIDALSARDDEGGRLAGSGVLAGARAGRLSLSLSRLRFVDREDVSAAADGDLAFTWGPDGAALSGALTLQEATIRGAPATAVDIPVLDVVEINRPQGATPREPVLARRGPAARLDLRITAPGRVYARYRGFASEWRLSLRAQGTTAAPLLYGEAELLRGDAQLAGRPLDVTRGVIRFRGPPEEASLDLVAEQRTPALTARVVLAGTVAAPEVRFENDAGLPEDEVLPQLLFGVSQQELSPLQAAQLAASLSALAGGAAFDLADMARRLVGLDRFDVRQGADGLVVAGGRYLTRDVYVELARNGLGEAQTRVEWRLSPSLTLVTSFAQNGEQRASLRWRAEEEDD